MARNPPVPSPQNFAFPQEFRTITAALDRLPTAPLRSSAGVVRGVGFADRHRVAFDSHDRNAATRAVRPAARGLRSLDARGSLCAVFGKTSLGVARGDNIGV